MSAQKQEKRVSARDKAEITGGQQVIVLNHPVHDNRAGAQTRGTKKVLMLEGLGCANCAAKMEMQTKNLAGVIDATVDFVSKKMTIEVAQEHELNRIIDEVAVIVKRIEPDVKIVATDNIFPTKVKATDLDDEHNHKQQIIKLLIGGALFLAGSILNLSNSLELTVFMISYIIVGGDVVLRAVKGIARGQLFSEHFLMSVATIGAFLIGAYAEGVAVMLFYLVGEMFQDSAVDHSRKSISALMDIRPDYANLQVGQDLEKVFPEEVKIGDIIVVKPGERIPLDGQVVAGNSLVDTSALTGESIPRELEPGKEALSGFINKHGLLTVKVTKTYGESTVAKILDLVQNASSKKAPTENFITKFARYYTPTVVFGALALAVIPPLAIAGATFSDWIYRALVFLVVSCPCALVISIPLGFFGGIGGASKRGILVKGGNYLEALNSIDTVVFDKTGTLTKGVFEVTASHPKGGFKAADLLEYAAYAEYYSNHPIAVSIRRAYKSNIDPGKIEDYREIAGQGINVNIEGKSVLAGNTKLMSNENIAYTEVDSTGTVIHIAVDQQYAGSIVISDEVKEDSAQAISQLKAIGIAKTIMFTGDLKHVGDRIGKQLGLDEVYSALLPADKVDKLESLMRAKKSSHGTIAFVGDGINDAPVLARADIGIAMGGLGSDAAIEAADVVIMTDEPSKIVSAIKIARKTRRIVYQNIVFALGVKAIFLVLGAMGIATMWEAVFGDMGVALIAIFNALRVMNVKNL